jgi:hypothetical protein
MEERYWVRRQFLSIRKVWKSQIATTTARKAKIESERSEQNTIVVT